MLKRRRIQAYFRRSALIVAPDDHLGRWPQGHQVADVAVRLGPVLECHRVRGFLAAA